MQAITQDLSPDGVPAGFRPGRALIPGILLLHGIIATSLPDRFDFLSTLFIVGTELAAIAACVQALREASPLAKRFWALLICAVSIHASAMSVEATTEIARVPIMNHIGGMQIFLSLLYGVPLLIAVSYSRESRVALAKRIIYATLSIAIGAVIYVEIVGLVSLHGSAKESDAVLITYLLDAMDVFLATAASIRWIGSQQEETRRYFQVLSIFCWANAILPAIHNRLLVHNDYVWLDLLLSAPYLILVRRVMTMRSLRARSFLSSSARIIEIGSPIFLASVLVLAGALIARAHPFVGIGAILVALAGYGALTTLAQSRGIEREEMLLASNQALEKLVDMDGLTGIANRRAFDETLQREFAMCQRTLRPLSLMMIDVDFFKQLNDARGHLTGDAYLIQLAGALTIAVPRSTDFLARYGGEEFAVILPSTDGAGASVAAEKVHRAISDLGLIHPTSPSGIVTVSIGIATLERALPCTSADLVECADHALYLAKRAGRNCSQFRSMIVPKGIVPFPAAGGR